MNAYEMLEKVRTVRPLVHHITNWVTIYDCANITRAFGALPVMAHAKEESADMARLASALVLNIGTLTPELVESMRIAGKAANEKGIPVILDLVGVGATKLRDDKAMELITNIRISVLKGNASEIARIAGLKAETKGVESGSVEASLPEVAKNLARERQCVAVITGKEDIVSDGHKTVMIRNGDPMMGAIVGTGCMSASIIGAFCGVADNKDYVTASACALSCFEIAGEISAKKSAGPGSFKENLYDAVFNLDQKTVNGMQKIEEVSIE